ncbi:MAG: sugar-binding transcriptional regulator [Lachnospiraceae bacterium]|nr:sugar-binding transcriptional regulator [Lachnospiraceae bacterium]
MRQYEDNELSVIAEIARMYYVEGLSQLEIAHLLFFSKAKVSRALRIAREQKIVEFQINYPLKQSTLLEVELKRKFDLVDAVVVTDLYDNENAEVSIKRIGEIGASYLDRVLKDGDRVGLSWGHTMHILVSQMKPKQSKRIQVVQLVGNSTETYATERDTPTLVQEMAKIYGGSYALLYAPMYIENDIVRKELMKERIIQSTLEKGRSVNYIVTGIADVYSHERVVTWMGFLSEHKKQELIRKGAVGYMCGYFFDKDGCKLNDRINDRIVGIQFDEILRVPNVIAVAGGIDKTNAIYAAIKGKLINCLITDSRIAEKLLSMADVGR